MINLDEYADVGANSIALFCDRNEIVYFNSFGVEHIKEFIGNKNVISNICRVQAIQWYVGIFALDSLILCSQVKKLTDFTDTFSPYDFEKNDRIILSYFKDEWMQFHWNW